MELVSEPMEPQVPCLNCGVLWHPGDWNFYNLCDECFGKFNAQKMRGRLSGIADYFESATDWIEANKRNK